MVTLAKVMPVRKQIIKDHDSESGCLSLSLTDKVNEGVVAVLPIHSTPDPFRYSAGNQQCMFHWGYG